MAQRLFSRRQIYVIRSGTPYQLAVRVIESYSMRALLNSSMDRHEKLDRHGTKRRHNVALILGRARNFPPDKVSFAACSALRLPALPVPARHRRLVRGNHFVSRAVLPDTATVDPHHA